MQTSQSNVLRRIIVLAFLFSFVFLNIPASAQASVTLVFHDIQINPLSGSQGYDVALYFSLLDSAQNPIKDAASQDFTLNEDNLPAKIDSVAAADNEPVNVALLLDTSGSMGGDKINAALKAASKFIDNLQKGDQVAVLTFDNNIKHRIDFTTDLERARQQIDLIAAIPGAYTCLYNAAYETVQLASAISSGRRAIILLTDGKDEAGNGQPCSQYSVNDVIALATQSKVQVPIYTIGLGGDADSRTLNTLASATGGRYLNSPGPTQLDALFGLLSSELRSQYVIHYTSTITSGQHALTLTVDYNSAKAQLSQNVDFPPLPYVISFTKPLDGSIISGKTSIAVNILGQGVPIAEVDFLANNASIVTLNQPPYQVDWDPSGSSEGPVLLEAVAKDSSGNVIVRSGVNVKYTKTIVKPTVVPPTSTKTGPETNKTTSFTTRIALVVVGASLLVILAAVIYMLIKRRKQKKESDQDWMEEVEAKERVIEHTIVEHPIVEDRTQDIFSLNGESYGALVVLNSDEPSMRDKRFEITKSVTTLGRKPNNDIVFQKDSPVSRQHAILEENSGLLYLSEVISRDDLGRPKLPSYGTFVNGVRIGTSQLLKDGDEIRLGKRLRLRFIGPQAAPGDKDLTTDQVNDSEESKGSGTGID